MAAATAKNWVEGSADLVGGGAGILVQQRLGVHENPVHAEAALRGLLFDERALQRVRVRRAAEPFERGDGPVLAPHSPA